MIDILQKTPVEILPDNLRGGAGLHMPQLPDAIKNITASAMTAENAEIATGLNYRSRPNAECESLRCCLGETREMKFFVPPDKKNPAGSSGKALFFHVIGYGSTWELAVRRAKQAQKK